MTNYWKSLAPLGLNGYEANPSGIIRSIDRFVKRKDTGKDIFVKGRVQKPQKDKGGYLRVRLSVSNIKSTHKVHRLIAKIFIPNVNNLPQVNHKDGNKENNYLDNLEWCNNSENQIHAVANKLIIHKTGKNHSNFKGDILVYDLTGVLKYTVQGSIALQEIGFDPRAVSACLLGKRNTHRQHKFVRQLVKEAHEN